MHAKNYQKQPERGKGFEKNTKDSHNTTINNLCIYVDGGSCCIDINISNRYIYSKIPFVNLYINVYWCTDMDLLQSTFEKEI